MKSAPENEAIDELIKVKVCNDCPMPRPYKEKHERCMRCLFRDVEEIVGTRRIIKKKEVESNMILESQKRLSHEICLVQKEQR
jgi:hypothetical protein